MDLNVEKELISERIKSLATSVKDSHRDKDENSSLERGLTLKRLECVNETLEKLREYQTNSAIRHIEVNSGIKGKILYLFKRLMRKLSLFLLQPVCEQQTIFNGLTADSVEHIYGISVYLEKIEELERKKVRKNKNLTLQLEKSISDLEMKFSDRERFLFSHLEKLENKLNLIVDSTGLTNLETENDFWEKLSYSQSGEDSIILYILNGKGIDLQKSTYLDIGANHAKEISNTYALYKRGMKGVLVEANPKLIRELNFYRPNDIIINKCISKNTGEKVSFYVMNADGLSTFDRKTAEEAMSINSNIYIEDKIEIEAISVNDILASYFTIPPTVVNVDIEGLEIEVLKTFNFEEYRPKIFVVESINYSDSIYNGDKKIEIVEYMENHNYIEYAFTGINSIFVDNLEP